MYIHSVSPSHQPSWDELFGVNRHTCTERGSNDITRGRAVCDAIGVRVTASLYWKPYRKALRRDSYRVVAMGRPPCGLSHGKDVVYVYVSEIYHPCKQWPLPTKGCICIILERSVVSHHITAEPYAARHFLVGLASST